MKDFLAVFTKSFKFCWRDPVSVGILTLFPIVIIFVLGNALGGMFEGNLDFIDEAIPIAAVLESDDSYLTEFLQNEEISRFMGTEFTDKETAITMLQERDAFLIITEENGEISVIIPQEPGLFALIALSIVDSYAQIGSAMTISMMEGGNFTELSSIMEAEISITEVPLGTRTASGMDYYAVTMLVMIMLFAGLNGMELFKKSMFSETGNRMLTTPVSKPALIGGLLASATVVSYVQGLITFVFTWAVYGVYWGDRIPLVLLTLFGLVLFSQAFSIFLLMLFKSDGAANAVSQVAIFVMTFVSGGYMPVSFGEAADRIFRFAPNALAQTVIFGSAFGGNESRMMTDLTVLFVYGGVLFIIAFLLGRRKLT